MGRQSVCVISVSSARSFVVVLVAFHEVHTPTHQFNFLNFILECGGAGNLGMLAAKTRLRVGFPVKSENICLGRDVVHVSIWRVV